MPPVPYANANINVLTTDSLKVSPTCGTVLTLGNCEVADTLSAISVTTSTAGIENGTWNTVTVTGGDVIANTIECGALQCKNITAQLVATHANVVNSATKVKATEVYADYAHAKTLAVSNTAGIDRVSANRATCDHLSVDTSKFTVGVYPGNQTIASKAWLAFDKTISFLATLYSAGTIILATRHASTGVDCVLKISFTRGKASTSVQSKCIYSVSGTTPSVQSSSNGFDVILPYYGVREFSYRFSGVGGVAAPWPEK